MNLEQKRIDFLHSTALLDTDPETMFDDITAIASAVCQMPIALISLIDINRQFFKSQLGLNTRHTPIDQSFCKIAIESPTDLFIIEDARLDSRFKDNLLVTNNPNIVSYYGVPLNSKEGIAYGTLCVIDQKVGILNDEQKSILLKLSKQIEHLIELRINNKLLVNYQAKVERYSKDMEEFASIAAHDLKAPVRAIHSFISLLEKKYEQRWDEKDKKYLAFVHQSALKMNSLIQDLLEFSKSTANTNNLESFDVKELVSELFESLTYGTRIEKSSLICGDLPTIFSSKIAFSILFNNLINNALKYQSGDKIPLIEITSVTDEKNWIFTVKDNGIGIDSNYLDEIFKPFKRLHSAAEFHGNGLGLTACAKIMDHLGGEISVTSDAGQGSIFKLMVPKN